MSRNIKNIKSEKKKDLLSDFTKIFAESSEDATSLDRELSYMLSCKVFYESLTPKLESGAILSRKDNGNMMYLICIQPACDCLRIKKYQGRKFLFLPLKIDNERFDISIPNKQSSPLNLQVNLDADAISTVKFHPVNDFEPILATEDNDNWVFTTKSSHKYKWIATLKGELVLRLAHSYGKNISRIGPTESEWQRRWAK